MQKLKYMISIKGLHLRSIEEPSTNPAQFQYNSYTSNTHNTSINVYASPAGGVGGCSSIGSGGGRMTTELGGTGYGSEQNVLLNNRTGVPLATYQQHQYQQHQQQQQQQQQNNSSISCTLSLGLNPLSPQRHYDPEYARMEAWMDEHQEFVQDYFIRKATRQVVDAWLVSHATSAGNDTSNTSPTHPNGQNCSSRGGSGATTPVRKISAHEFERGGLLKPIVNTIDGTPTFLSIGTTNDCSMATTSGNSTNNSNGSMGNNSTLSSGGGGGGGGCGGPGNANSGGGNGIGGSCSSSSNQMNSGHNSHYYPQSGHHHHHHHNHYRPQRLSRNELKQLDEKELIFELVKDICNELEVRSLCHKILQNVSILLNADRGSLFLVQGRCSGSADGPKKCLVSKLFDVCPRSTVEEMEQQDEVQIAWGTGIAGHVAESGEPVNIPDAYKDERFNCEIDTLTGYRTKALLCMPIKDSSGDVIGVAQVINKLNGECFSETDEKVFASYLQFCGIGLRNAQLYEKSQLEIKRNQVLLDLARMIFEEQSTIEHMVFRILTHMQSLIQCQRVQILLVHEASKGSFSRVFDFEANDLSEEESTNRTSPYESRFPINVGITGHVATTGETVNVPNAYEDDRFDPSVDEGSNFKHKSILCMAIKNSLGQIIGVIQLINKFDNLVFTKNDENFVEAFAIFCGMGIHNTHMYEKAIVAMAKQSVTLEVLSYHASATMDEAHRLRRLRVPSAAHFRLHDFRFDDIHFEDDDTLKACLRMFLDLDFVERFHIDYEVLCRWLLSVKKNYRNVTYHNWRHAFNVAQMMFAILTISHHGQATQWWKIFGEMECLALIIACLCHDLDHRGTNNSFQIKASSPLAQLYSTSTMEHHHFDQCLMILNSPGNQILANLSSEDYCRVIKVLEDAILSTDLAVYLRKRGTFLQDVHQQPLSYWIDEEPRALLRAMSMTVCDLSAITKPWDIEKRVADLVSSEFFEQGDMEKQELNITPIDIMNREKEDELPMMQVGFIDSICLPIYEAFSTLSDKLEPLVEGVRDNRQHWIELAQGVETKQTKKSNGIVKAKNNKYNNSNNCNNNKNSNNEKSTENGGGTDCGDGNALNSRLNDADDNETLQNNATTDECPDDEVDEAEETGIEADDDDSEVEMEHHSNDGYSSDSSHLSTPPPTGEEDSSPTSPAKTEAATKKQAQLMVENLESLNHNPLHKQRNSSSLSSSCRNCECMRLRKTSSLKGASDYKSHPHTGGSHKSHSKSTPSMTSCGTTATQGAGHQQNTSKECHCHQSSSSSSSRGGGGHHHHHHHHHAKHSHHQHQSLGNTPYHSGGHHHHHYHHHHHHHHQGNSLSSSGGGGGNGSAGSSLCGGLSNNSSLSESDKIPKIVGKLGNLDALHHVTSGGGATTTTNSNGSSILATPPNGLVGFGVPNLLASRRHSEVNGGMTLNLNSNLNSCSTSNVTLSPVITPPMVAAIAAAVPVLTPDIITSVTSPTASLTATPTKTANAAAATSSASSRMEARAAAGPAEATTTCDK
ncbi:phosphodiesterase 11 isoform X3 [Musca autumnalis]|uniref:phosphodiesterase 11 isoform X3 n=1 Tax=Musca autumnalis TaxID=221902 RepID=UPI003CF1EDA7